MAKTETVFARVEPEVKASAEAVLAQIGVPMSNAIDMFLRQIVAKNGMPFPLVARRRPLNLEEMDAEQLCAEIEKGILSAESGKTHTANEVFAEYEL